MDIPTSYLVLKGATVKRQEGADQAIPFVFDVLYPLTGKELIFEVYNTNKQVLIRKTSESEDDIKIDTETNTAYVILLAANTIGKPGVYPFKLRVITSATGKTDYMGKGNLQINA